MMWNAPKPRLHRTAGSIGLFLAAALLTATPASAQYEAGQSNGQYGGSFDTETSSGTNAGTSTTAETQTSEAAAYEENEIVNAVADFFGVTTEAAAEAVARVFQDKGKPNAYIRGEEGAGAFIGGLRYGKGQLIRKGHQPLRVYWQGPSLGFDFGGNASKTFVLVYNLENEDQIFHRFPGPEAAGYFIAGIGVNYQQRDNVILAPMRTGVGLRGGINLGYLSYTRERHWMPF